MTDVLIVDDDFDIRETIGDVLTDEGFSVATAADGDDALAWLRTNPAPKVILLDWMMPRCDGATFRKKQLQDPSISRIPVVLLTADATLEIRSAALGVAAFMRKPVSLSTLVEVVSRFR